MRILSAKELLSFIPFCSRFYSDEEYIGERSIEEKELIKKIMKAKNFSRKETKASITKGLIKELIVKVEGERTIRIRRPDLLNATEILFHICSSEGIPEEKVIEEIVKLRNLTRTDARLSIKRAIVQKTVVRTMDGKLKPSKRVKFL